MCPASEEPEKRATTTLPPGSGTVPAGMEDGGTEPRRDPQHGERDDAEDDGMVDQMAHGKARMAKVPI